MRSTYLKYTTALLLLCGMALPGIALCQALPWQQSLQSQTGREAATSSSSTSSHHHNAASNPAPSSASGDTRTQDDHKLDNLAARFYALHEKDTDAIRKMKALEKEVSHFAQSMQSKSAESDISHDAGHLLERITRQRKEWEARASAGTSIATGD